MEYGKPFISTPVAYTDTYVMDVGTMGDSYFFSLVDVNLPELSFNTKPRTPAVRTQPNVFVIDRADRILDSKNEGTALEIQIGCSDAPKGIVNVTVTVSFADPFFDLELLRHEPEFKGSLSNLIEPAADVDFTSLLSYSVDIPAGDKSATLVIPTVDDAKLTNKYRYAKVTITAVTSPDGDYIVNNSLDYGWVLLRDNNVNPVGWEGQVELWVRPHRLAHFEPLYDEKDQIVTFTFGNDAANETTLRSYAVDDLPIHEFRFQQVAGEVATDPAGVELFADSQPLYQVIMQTGRRR